MLFYSVSDAITSALNVPAGEVRKKIAKWLRNRSTVYNKTRVSVTILLFNSIRHNPTCLLSENVNKSKGIQYEPSVMIGTNESFNEDGVFRSEVHSTQPRLRGFYVILYRSFEMFLFEFESLVFFSAKRVTGMAAEMKVLVLPE